MENWLEQAIKRALNKISNTSDLIRDTFPHVSHEGKYDATEPSWWTSGFWSGILWLAYNETKNEKFKTFAISCEEKLDEPLNNYFTLHHDVGFMWLPSAVAHYKYDGNVKSLRRGLIAASHLAGRFNLNGNFIRAWNNNVQEDCTGWAIIDCLMNLPLLYWASEYEKDPRFKSIAIAHTDTVLKEFIREDGSVRHIVCFDPEKGNVVKVLGGQGYSPDSAWARGAAWCIYGMALAYKYVGDKKYLDAAKKVSNFFINNLREDYMAVWDFRASKETSYAMDSSAVACAASGILEIARFCEEDRDYYIEIASKMLKSLGDNYGSWEDEQEGLITLGTVHLPANKNINVPIIYGDYYYLEGLLKLEGKYDLIW